MLTRTKSRLVAPFAACAILGALASSAVGSPYFRIGEGGSVSWEQALSSGMIHAVNPEEGFTNSARAFYNQTAGPGNYGMVEPVLTTQRVEGPSANGGTETHDSLLMSWGNVGATNQLPVANWQFTYGEDPDLTGSIICFSLYPPPGVWDFSLELIDVNGNSRGWFRSMPNNFWAEICIDPSKGVQSPFDFYFTDPDFDLTKVITIRLNESGNGQNFPLNPGGEGLPPYWNAWNHLEVRRIPEPSSWILLGLGAFGCWTLRHRLAITRPCV